MVGFDAKWILLRLFGFIPKFWLISIIKLSEEKKGSMIFAKNSWSALLPCMYSMVVLVDERYCPKVFKFRANQPRVVLVYNSAVFLIIKTVLLKNSKCKA